jgi:hypothetical protein
MTIMLWKSLTTAPREATPMQTSTMTAAPATVAPSANRQLLKTFVLIAFAWLLLVAFALTKLSAQSLTISPIADQFTAISTPVSIQVTISDANPNSVLMQGIADNNDLIPNENIVISQTGTTRQMTITPTPGRTGTTTITVIGTNRGGQNAQVLFNISVGGASPAPVISNIAPATTLQNRSVTVNFNVTDPNASVVTVSASTDNPTLVPQANLALGGVGTARTLTITPNFGQVGNGIITITATNTSGFSSRQSFTLTVNRADNAMPSITSPGDITVAIGNTATGFFNVLDPSGAQNVNVFGSSSNPALIPDANIRISGIGSARTVSLTPLPGRRGQATIVLQALNPAGLSASTAFTLFVADPFERPVLQGLRDTTILQNTTLSFPFTVVDANVNTVVFEASSGNPSLVAESSISITGTGTNRTLIITPTQNRFGEVPISIFARNQNAFTGLAVVRLTVVSPPSIAPVAPLSTRINTPVQTTITVSDATPILVNVTASSSNPDLIPNQNIVISDGAAKRTVTITPSANRTGTATITLTARNNAGLTAVTSFPVTVFQPQTPPSLGAISSVATQRNVPVSIMFTVNDADVNTLRFSASSSNPGVFPIGNISVTGTGTTRVITLIPAANVTGTSQITLTATNSAGLSSSTSFAATVVPPPAAPTITAIINLTTERNRPVSQQFIVSDEDLATIQLIASSNNQLLLPNGNLQITGFGANRTITITPGFNQVGMGVVTITATNRQGQTATLTLNVTVTPTLIPPTIQPIGNIIIGQSQSTQRQVFVNDENLNTLRFNFESSNQALLPIFNLFITGAGSTRTLTVTPTFARSGTSEARITVTNQLGLSANTSFLLTVVPPPVITPPPISPPNTTGIPNLTTRVNTATNSSFTVVDESGFPLRFTVQSSNETLVPVGNVRLERDGNTVRVFITPAQDQTGRARITVTVSNGFSSSSISFDVEVLPPPVVPRIPFLIAPPNNTTGLSINQNQFRWSSVPGAVLYHVQIANDSLFQLIYLNNPELTDTTWVITTFNIERDYFWRARALFGLTPGDWSEVWRFRTGRARPGGTFTNSAETQSAAGHSLSTTEGIVQRQIGSDAAQILNSGARLITNIPNPFSETTRIEYELGEDLDVRLEITDVLGKKVAELVNTRQRAGLYAVEWNAHSLPSGVYVYTLHTPKQIIRKQMVVQR